jgi:hypothetical protein
MHHEAEPWPVQAMAHSKLLRPYSPRRLTQALYGVDQIAGSLANAQTRLLVDMPVLPEAWISELDRLQTDLFLLVEASREAWKALEGLKRSAPADYGRALDAVVCVLRGLGEPVETAA